MGTTEDGKKKKKKRNPFIWIILIIAVCVFIFAGYNLLKIALRYKEAADAYKSIAAMLEPNPDYVDPDELDDTDDEDPTGDSKKRRNDSVPFLWDFDKMRSINPDAQGWIYEKDLLDYPIVQGKDNDHYLHLTFDGLYNFAGTLFVDYQMRRGLSGLYSIVYGHNMNDGSMFGCLSKYQADPSFYFEHPTMHVFIRDKHYIYNVVAAYRAAIDGFTYDDALNYADVTDFVEKARQESSGPMYPGEITDDTNIIVLSTCTDASEDYYRFVVILSRDHEVE